MILTEKLDVLKAQTKDNNSSLSKKTGIPYTTIDGLYKKGYKNMQLKTLEALCEYFNVPLDYLAKDDNENDATIEEARLITIYRSLNATGKREMLNHSEYLASSDTYKKDISDVAI